MYQTLQHQTLRGHTSDTNGVCFHFTLFTLHIKFTKLSIYLILSEAFLSFTLWELVLRPYLQLWSFTLVIYFGPPFRHYKFYVCQQFSITAKIACDKHTYIQVCVRKVWLEIQLFYRTLYIICHMIVKVQGPSGNDKNKFWVFPSQADASQIHNW